jgi:glycosyltransferase involved in cell wall biosynthesis
LEKVPVSVAIITKNEEENIRSCLQSISFAGQIVVDSGSTDATLSIAAEFGCKIYDEALRGFGPQKQSAIEKCRQPWILVQAQKIFLARTKNLTWSPVLI